MTSEAQKLDASYGSVIEANIELHSRLAKDYNTCEPHFRPENIGKVEQKLRKVAETTQAKRMLDLGCGTGFLINIAKSFVPHIDGVDVTKAMLDQVNLSGPAKIVLHNQDVGTFPAEAGAYDMVTAYSFLHHLYDIEPALRTAYRALRKGGMMYVDLDPNYYFWEQIKSLDRHGSYDPMVKREIEMVAFKDEDIERQFGVAGDTFNRAEYFKNIKGGFKEEELREAFRAVGFSDVQVQYHWFLGEGNLINDPNFKKEEALKHAEVCSSILQRSWPLSRSLFKYLCLVATK